MHFLSSLTLLTFEWHKNRCNDKFFLSANEIEYLFKFYDTNLFLNISFNSRADVRDCRLG